MTRDNIEDVEECRASGPCINHNGKRFVLRGEKFRFSFKIFRNQTENRRLLLALRRCSRDSVAGNA